MDNHRFDRWTKLFATADRPPISRRQAITATAGLAALARLFSADETAGQDAAAKRCLNEGKECQRGNQCCSGLCKGKKCRRAKGQGNCTIKKDVCKPGNSDASFCDAGPGVSCTCQVRLSGAAFCADALGGGGCVRCSGDADCVAQFGAGFVCLRSGGNCCQGTGETTGCLRPCPNPA